jgi:hypothetical protein
MFDVEDFAHFIEAKVTCLPLISTTGDTLGIDNIFVKAAAL